MKPVKNIVDWEKFKAEKLEKHLNQSLTPAEQQMIDEEYERQTIEIQRQNKDAMHRRGSCLMMDKESIYHGIRLECPNIAETDIVRFLKSELLNPKPFYLLIGGVGSGKTMGAVSFVSELLFPRPHFVTAYKLCDIIQRKDFDKLDMYENAKALIIDDLGTEPEGFKGKDFQAYFEGLFNVRYEKKRFTVITSNLKADQIKQIYGDRFISRFRQFGVVFESTNGDMRRGDL